MKAFNSLVLINDILIILSPVLALSILFIPYIVMSMEQINQEQKKELPFEAKLDNHLTRYSTIASQEISKLRKAFFEIIMIIEEAPENQNLTHAITQQESLKAQLSFFKKSAEQATSYVYNVTGNSKDIPQNLSLTQTRYQNTIAIINRNREILRGIEEQAQKLTLLHKEKSQNIKELELQLNLARKEKEKIDTNLATQHKELSTAKAALGLLCIQAQNYTESMEKQKNKLDTAQKKSKKTEELLSQVNATLISAQKNKELLKAWNYRADLQNYISEDTDNESITAGKYSSEVPSLQEVGDFFSALFSPKTYIPKEETK